ncbi:MAG: hypothetical protein HOP28_07170 [Gemmatimonadales bacterium]|nr:hypothetical protein [Gemmatimonadales bacterium]
MSRARACAAIAALLLGTAHRVPAQSVTAWRDSTLALTARYSALRDSIGRADSTLAEAGRRGDLAMASTLPQRQFAARLLEDFAELRQRRFGEALPDDRGFRISVRTFESRSVFERFDGRDRNPGKVQLTGLSGSGRDVERYERVDRVYSILVQAYTEMMFESLPVTLRKWLEFRPPLEMEETNRRYVAMYSVATGVGRAERGCIDSHIADCAYVLRLRESTDSAPGGTYPPFVRADLLLFALDRGGDSAWIRFRNAGDVLPIEALAAASRLEPDSLILAWRRDILGLRPTEGVLDGRGLLLALGWGALFLAGALGVSKWV